MNKNIRLFSIIAVFGVAVLVGAYWFQQYLKGSKASSVPAISFAIANGKKIAPGDQFEALVQITPNGKTFYSVELSFVYDTAKLKLQNEADPLANLTALSTTNSTPIDVKFISTGTSVDPATGKVKIMAIRDTGTATNNPFIGGTQPIAIAKIALVMKDTAALPFTIAWDGASKTSLPDTIEKQDLIYTGLEPTNAPISYIYASDDFSGTSLKPQWWTWVTPEGGSSVGVKDGVVTLYNPPGNGKSLGSSIGMNVPEGDFVTEITLKSHSANGMTGNFGMHIQIENGGGSYDSFMILRPYNNAPGEIVVSVNSKDLNLNWDMKGVKLALAHTDPVRVKIERKGSTMYAYYDLLMGQGYQLVRQLSAFKIGKGTVSIFDDTWGPDFPSTSGVADDFKMTSYKAAPTGAPIPTNIPPIGAGTGTPIPGAATPYPTTGIVKCGIDVCQTNYFCYYPPVSDCVAGETCIDMYSEPYCKLKDGKLELTPTPVLGSAGTVANTTKIYEGPGMLYINSIMTYPAPLRYEQPIKLEAGSYSLVLGARMAVRKGTGLVIVIQCNEASCGENNDKKKLTQNSVIYRTPTFPLKTDFSELRQSFTISSSVSNKQLVVRIYCEDGSECEIDYLSLEDAWGSERLKNPMFTEVQKINDVRKQPTSWEIDTTANMYGSIDQACGVRGALMINNPAK